VQVQAKVWLLSLPPCEKLGRSIKLRSAYSSSQHPCNKYPPQFHWPSFARLRDERSWNETNKKLEAKDVLPNTNCTQAAERAKNAIFGPGDLDLDTCPSERPNPLFCMNLAQIHSVVPETFHTQTKNYDWWRQKQNLPQFTACVKDRPRAYINCSTNRRPITCKDIW